MIQRVELEPHGAPDGDDHLLLVGQVRPVDDEQPTWETSISLKVTIVRKDIILIPLTHLSS